jgi:drug/metabolite transporter (DMT)-like permease
VDLPNSPQIETKKANARLMLVVLSFAWGLTWPAMRIVLDEIPPFGLRALSAGLGMSTLFTLAFLQRRSLRIPAGPSRIHLAVASLFNVVGFTLLTSFAQLGTSTSRVVILAYTMPIWASLLAIPVLGERLNAARVAALILCASGLAVLTYPLAASTLLLSIFLALGAGVSWAVGTVYLKWSRITGDPIAIAGWQLAAGFLVVSVLLPFFEGIPNLFGVRAVTLLALAFAGVVGAGLAYFLWFTIVDRVPAMTASLGSLAVPVVGIASSMVVLGERPTAFDIIGFILVIGAASCVLLLPEARVGAKMRTEPTP